VKIEDPHTRDGTGSPSQRQRSVWHTRFWVLTCAFIVALFL